MNQIKIETNTYHIIDTKENMTIPDCMVLKNKIGTGHGEAKLYVGQGEEVSNFFGDFSNKCIILKSDLINYLQEVKDEYKKPQQPYKNKLEMPKAWDKYLKEANTLQSEINEFKIYKANVTPPRIYINSDNDIYKFIRKIALPNITYLSALKLKFGSEDVLYFKLFVDYFGNETKSKEIENKIKDNPKLSKSEKESLVKSRIGQGKYREGVLEECPFCPITLVSDDRLLIASHIKPWAKSELKEKTDPKNGFMLTPTYDFLFDRGFITFTDDKKMIVSPWLSKMTCSKLGLLDEKNIPLLPTQGREVYLKYHREFIFKK